MTADFQDSIRPSIFKAFTRLNLRPLRKKDFYNFISNKKKRVAPEEPFHYKPPLPPVKICLRIQRKTPFPWRVFVEVIKTSVPAA